MDPITILAICSLAAAGLGLGGNLFGSIFSGKSADKDREAENQRIKEQNALNMQMYNQSKEDNSIVSQVADAKSAGYNLNFFSPSHVATTPAQQTAGTNSTSARQSNMLKTLANALSGGSQSLSSSVMDFANGYMSVKQQMEQRKLQKDYNDARLELARQQLEELKKVNKSKIAGIDLNNLMLSKKVNAFDQDFALKQALGWQKYDYNSQANPLSIEGLMKKNKYLGKQIALADTNIKINKVRKDLLEYDKKLKKKYHDYIYTDAYFNHLAAFESAMASRKLTYANEVLPLLYDAEKAQYLYGAKDYNWLYKNYGLNKVIGYATQALGAAGSLLNIGGGIRSLFHSTPSPFGGYPGVSAPNYHYSY